MILIYFYLVLLVLFKTESFKTNERFEYFYGFRYKYNLLDQINYVLSKQNKKILISLDKCDDEIATEAIEYSLYYFDNSRQKEDLISAITVIMPYIGFPRTLNALAIVNEICD